MVQVRADGSAAPALGKHEELSGLRCTCGPEHLRLRSNWGELVQPRGRSVNQCEYCARLAAVENCEMLVLDALEGDAPQLVAILGTRTATLDMEAFAAAREYVVDAVRRRWPAAQYAYEVEFTTGYGPRSGGKRRPHWNWFWKHIPRADRDRFREVVVRTWCKHVDAEPAAQYVDEIRNEVGLTKYVTEHFMKASQRPPEGFSGQRFCASRNYFGEGVSVQTARARARESLKRKRAIWRAQHNGFGAHDAELIAHEELELAKRTVWVLTNDRGARVGAIQHDPRRMVLPSYREGVNHERTTHTRPAPESTGAGSPVGRVLDPPTPPGVEDRPDVDVSRGPGRAAPPARAKPRSGAPARTPVSPADRTNPLHGVVAEDTPASLLPPVVDGERRPGGRARQVREGG